MACVRKLKGRWVADYRDAQGNRHREFRRTKKEAEELLTQRLDDIGKGRFNPEGRRVTFKAFAEDWLAVKSRAWAPNTRDIHRNSVRRHLLHPEFGLAHYRVAEIDLKAVERFRNELTSNSPKLSNRSVNLVLTSLGGILKHAVRHGLRSNNPVEFIDRLPEDRKEIKPLTPTETEKLLRKAKEMDEQFHAITAVAVYTGMRMGEILATRWRDIDLQGRVITVHGTNSHKSQRQQFERSGQFGTTKTEQSRRRVKLSPSSTQVLREHRVRTGSPTPDSLVFANHKGLPLDPSNFRDRLWKPLLAEMGFRKGFTFHGLRHTYASHMLSSGAPVEFVQRQLGHSSFQTTLSIYRHWIPDRDDLHADIIEAALTSSGQ
jgi:integrase